MATMPTFQDGKEIDSPEWNSHANQINSNTSDISTNTSNISGLDGRVTSLESQVLQARYYQTTVQTITAANPEIPAEFNTALNETPGVTASANNSVFTFQQPGVWQVNVSIRLGASAGGGERYTAVADANDHLMRYVQENTYPADAVACMSPAFCRFFFAGDAITVLMFQDSGQDIGTIDAFGEGFSISLTRIGS